MTAQEIQLIQLRRSEELRTKEVQLTGGIQRMDYMRAGLAAHQQAQQQVACHVLATLSLSRSLSLSLAPSLTASLSLTLTRAQARTRTRTRTRTLSLSLTISLTVTLT